jgi:hypothetical protein
VELPDSLWSILKGIFIQHSNDLFIFAAQEHKNWTFRTESVHPFWKKKVVLFGILDCSHNLQTFNLCYCCQSYSILVFWWMVILCLKSVFELLSLQLRAYIFFFGFLSVVKINYVSYLTCGTAMKYNY